MSCLSRQQDASRKKKSFLPTMGIPSGFLMGVNVLCVLRRRHDATSCGQGRVRTDQVQCDIRTAQYKLFNFSVNKFISGVNTNKSFLFLKEQIKESIINLGVNSYPNGVNPVSRVIQTIWCDFLSIVNITLFWCEQTIMVKSTLLV